MFLFASVFLEVDTPPDPVSLLYTPLGKLIYSYFLQFCHIVDDSIWQSFH